MVEAGGEADRAPELMGSESPKSPASHRNRCFSHALHQHPGSQRCFLRRRAGTVEPALLGALPYSPFFLCSPPPHRAAPHLQRLPWVQAPLRLQPSAYPQGSPAGFHSLRNSPPASPLPAVVQMGTHVEWAPCHCVQWDGCAHCLWLTKLTLQGRVRRNEDPKVSSLL